VVPFHFGLDSRDGYTWAKSVGIQGSPFRRGRRTVTAVGRREPIGHSEGTHDRQYVLPDPQVQAAAVPIIADGAEDALASARNVVLVAELRDEADPDDVTTATADCKDFEDGPEPGPDGGCAASFLTCLACENARVHPGHHPRLAHLHQVLGSARSVLPAPRWSSDWGDAHARLEHLKSKVGAQSWTKALSQVTDDDRDIIDHLLAGDLNP
jgi:hypothetical protein